MTIAFGAKELGKVQPLILFAIDAAGLEKKMKGNGMRKEIDDIQRLIYIALIVCAIAWCFSTGLAIWLLLDPPKACAYLEGKIYE